MLEVERFEKILEYLREKKTAPVSVLAKRLYVSEATMRRDLTELERRGLIKRLHGGAILLDGANQELPLYMRERQNTNAKRIISEKASRYIAEGQTIFLDASSTAQYLIKYFEGFQNLTIITNGMENRPGTEFFKPPHLLHRGTALTQFLCLRGRFCRGLRAEF